MAQPIKQEYIYKEELDLDWEEEEGLCDALNPIVVIERLPEHIVRKYLPNQKCVKVETDKDGSPTACVRFCESCQERVESVMYSSARCPKCKGCLTYECNNCKKHSLSYSAMTYHLKTACRTVGSYYQCPGCPYKSAFKYRIKYHMQIAHKDLSISDIKRITSQNLEQDLQKSDKYIHQCVKCGRKFKQINQLKVHASDCAKFNFSVKSRNQVRIKTEDGESSSTVTLEEPGSTLDTISVAKMSVLYCKKCRKRTALQDTVYVSKKCSKCKSSFVFECTKCKKQYPTAHGIVYHFRAICGGQEMYSCSKCSYQTPIKSLFNKHNITVHDSNYTECPKCQIILKHKVSLISHLKHCGMEPYLYCNDCSFKTNNRTALKTHIKRHFYNTNKIEATCSICEKKFKNPYSLKSHMSYCGKEPYHHCTLCNYRSYYKKNIKLHLIRVHFRDESTFPVCPKCGVKFENKNIVNAHLRFCKTSKPHVECDNCPYMCDRKIHLRRHMLRRHLRNNDESDNSDVNVEN